MSRTDTWLNERLRLVSKRPTELAGLLAVSPSTVSRIGRGYTRLDAQDVPSVAAFLQVSETDVVANLVAGGVKPRPARERSAPPAPPVIDPQLVLTNAAVLFDTLKGLNPAERAKALELAGSLLESWRAP